MMCIFFSLRLHSFYLPIYHLPAFTIKTPTILLLPRQIFVLTGAFWRTNGVIAAVNKYHIAQKRHYFLFQALAKRAIHRISTAPGPIFYNVPFSLQISEIMNLILSPPPFDYSQLHCCDQWRCSELLAKRSKF